MTDSLTRVRTSGWWGTDRMSTGNVFTPRVASVRVSFEDPLRNLTAGSQDQEWRIKARRDRRNTPPGSEDPKLTVELLDARGVVLDKPIDSIALSSFEPQVLQGIWDAGLLANRNGHDVEARVLSVSMSAHSFIDIGGLKWVPTTTTDLSIDLTLSWRTLAWVSKDLTLRWNVAQNLTAVSKDVSLVWNTLANVSKDLSLSWSVLSSNVQTLRPDGDVLVSDWTVAPLYAKIDEPPYSDTDLITSSNSTNTACEVSLTDAVKPNSNAGYVVRYRYAKSASGGNARNLTVALVGGTNQIASATHTGISEVFTAGSFTLSAFEVASISDYADLRLRFTSGGTTSTPAGNRRSVLVSWAEFEIPIQQWPVPTDTLLPSDSLVPDSPEVYPETTRYPSADLYPEATPLLLSSHLYPSPELQPTEDVPTSAPPFSSWGDEIRNFNDLTDPYSSLG